jgi:cation:H+ antiporter
MCSRLAISWRLSSGVIALTLIAAGTSLPELATNIAARISAAPASLTLGSLLGSNITNIALVLGSCILLFPIEIRRSERRQVGLLALLTLFLGLILARERLGRYEGAFLTMIGLFTLIQPWLKERAQQKNELAQKRPVFAPASGLIVAGLIVCMGAWGFVEGALRFSEAAHISTHFVAITVVALGTSLPEWITSLVAGKKREHAFIISQVVGSNFFNMLTILGISALIRPMELPRITFVRDYLTMLALTLLLYFFAGKKPLPKCLGLVLIAAYALYIGLSA